MTEDEFCEYYSRNSGKAWSELKEWLVPLPCACGEEGCQGWQMVTKETARRMKEDGQNENW